MTDEHVERGAREEAAGAPLTPTEAEAEKRPASHTAGEPSDDSADDEPHRPE